MPQLVSLLEYNGSLTALQQTLLPHLAASGLTLPDDYEVIERIKAKARLGQMEAALFVQNGDVAGLIAWHHRDGAGHLVLFYVLPAAPPAVAGALLNRALQALRTAAPTQEILAELPEAIPAVQEALWAAGFVGTERQVMRADLRDRAWEVYLPAEYSLRAWADDYFDAGAHVIYQANVGTLDSWLMPELRTLESIRDLLRDTLAGRYGSFDREASGVVIAREGEVVAAILATRRSGDEGFVAEINVLPQHRRHGLARALMNHAHSVFIRGGCKESLLGVTAANPARYLYEHLGYGRIGVVWSYVYPPPPGWPGS